MPAREQLLSIFLGDKKGTQQIEKMTEKPITLCIIMEWMLLSQHSVHITVFVSQTLHGLQNHGSKLYCHTVMLYTDKILYYLDISYLPSIFSSQPHGGFKWILAPGTSGCKCVWSSLSSLGTSCSFLFFLCINKADILYM